MADANRDSDSKSLDAPGSLKGGGSTIPNDHTAVDTVAPTAPHASQCLNRGSLGSTGGQSNRLSSMARDPVAQAHHDIYNSVGCALPPSLLAQQIAYNYPMTTPSPFASPSATVAPQSTPATKKGYRRTPVSELSAQEKEARQTFLASCEQDREIFLNFLKEPNHGGLTPGRLAVLQRVFKHHTLSSVPTSVAGIEANKKARREGLVEIAQLKEKNASGVQGGIDDLSRVHREESKGVSVPENEQGIAPENMKEAEGNAEGNAESEGTSTGTSTETEGQERVSDGITLSYSLNGKDCTKEELDNGTSRYPPTVPSQYTEFGELAPIAEYLDHQPTLSELYRQRMQNQQMQNQQMQNQQMQNQQRQNQQMQNQERQNQQLQGQFIWAPPYEGPWYDGYPRWS